MRKYSKDWESSKYYIKRLGMPYSGVTFLRAYLEMIRYTLRVVCCLGSCEP